jgi:hypothetical protein
LKAVRIYESIYPDITIFGFSSAGAAASWAKLFRAIRESDKSQTLIFKFFIFLIMFYGETVN